MAEDQGIQQEEVRRRIRLDDDVYERVSNGMTSRYYRSRVSLYNGDDIKDMAPYEYNRLHSMRRRIRLLRLHGGGLSNPEITCELFEVEYDKEQQNVVKRVDNNLTIEYEALSWCWGKEEKNRAIRIQKNGRYYRMAVSKELSLALKYLRHRHENRILWIDALCIDQQNHEERNHQVQMMARIYNGATQACIWLGEDNDDSTKAIDFIQYVIQHHFTSLLYGQNLLLPRSLCSVDFGPEYYPRSAGAVETSRSNLSSVLFFLLHLGFPSLPQV